MLLAEEFGTAGGLATGAAAVDGGGLHGVAQGAGHARGGAFGLQRPIRQAIAPEGVAGAHRVHHLHARYAVMRTAAVDAQPGALGTKGQGNAAGALGGKTLGDLRCMGDVGMGEAEQLQVFIAGLDPIGQGRYFAHGGHVGGQISRQFGTQVDVHADGPALGFGTLQHGQHLVVFRRYQHQ